jgi:hypothetical protein
VVSVTRQLPTRTSLEVLEQDRRTVLAMAEGAGRASARLGTPRHMNPYPDNGLHVEQREAWFRAYDEESK